MAGCKISTFGDVRLSPFTEYGGALVVGADTGG